MFIAIFIVKHVMVPGRSMLSAVKHADILKPSGREFCGSCHAKNAAKPKDAVFQVDLAEA